jgi:hypothetical protein
LVGYERYLGECDECFQKHSKREQKLLVDNTEFPGIESVNVIDPETKCHYSNHTYAQEKWKPHHNLEKYGSPTAAPSSASANYDITDYNSTDFEVVLETLFDDQRCHITEKVLRPIACGQPFLIAGPPNCLKYLKSYGFQTFSDIWDESYDQETDAVRRLEAIVNSMEKISQWNAETKFKKLNELKKIVEHNKKHFFSNKFMELIISELNQNLNQGLTELNNCNNNDLWLKRWDLYLKHPEINHLIDTNTDELFPTRLAYNKIRESIT